MERNEVLSILNAYLENLSIFVMELQYVSANELCKKLDILILRFSNQLLSQTNNNSNYNNQNESECENRS